MSAALGWFTSPGLGLFVALYLGFTHFTNGSFPADETAYAGIDRGRRDARASLALHTVLLGLLFGPAPLLLLMISSFTADDTAAIAATVGVTVPFGALLGAATGMSAGGWYLVLQRRARRAAVRQGLLPHDLVGFLHAAVEARALRRTGGGVQFRHRTLADRLATAFTPRERTRTPTQQGVGHVTPDVVTPDAPIPAQPCFADYRRFGGRGLGDCPAGVWSGSLTRRWWAR